MPQQKVNDTHSLHSTPNNTLWLLKVEVQVTVLASDPFMVPPEGTLYKNFDKRLFGKDWLKAFEDYRYIQSAEGENANVVSLLFFPSLTDAQRNKPYRTLSYFGDHRWPPILHSIVFIKDNTFPRFTSGGKGGQGAIISGPTYYAREVYTPECYEGSRFLQEEFISDVPYNIPLYPVPVPTAVSYDLPGIRGSFPECLHPKIVIPAAQTANAAFVAGDYATTSGAVQGQVFPATNFEDWSPYVLTDKQWFDNGYRRTRIQVAPPGVDQFPFTIQ